MKPYFDTSHLAGLLLLIATLGWSAMEASHAGNRQDEATRARGAGRAWAVWPFLVAATVMLYVGPRLVPAAANWVSLTAMVLLPMSTGPPPGAGRFPHLWCAQTPDPRPGRWKAGGI